MGLFAIFNSFLDREAVWTTPLGDVLPSALAGSSNNLLPEALLSMQLRHVGLSGWLATCIVLVMGSFHRVLWKDETVRADQRLQLSAISKLATPLLIAIAPFWLPTKTMENETRFLSVSAGLLMSFLTKKMICFSMAKQSYASVQMEAFPFYGAILLVLCDGKNEGIVGDEVLHYLLGGLCLWHAYRLVNWASMAIDQICKRLDIHCFSIKDKKKEE